MDQLDFVKIDRKAHGNVDPLLTEAMKQEPVALFAEMLRANRPVMEFLHADYATGQRSPRRHYGIPEVYGDQLRKVKLPAEIKRGGLLTAAGLLVMNSNGKDSQSAQARHLVAGKSAARSAATTAACRAGD